MQQHSDTLGIGWDDIRFVGSGLSRPESILATRSGTIFCGDHRYGVVRLDEQRSGPPVIPKGFLPNGIALLRSGEFLIANLDPATGGGIWKLDAEQRLRPWVMAADGRELSIANFVGIDQHERAWISVCTQSHPRELAFRDGVDDGYLVLADATGARIVAQGLGFANECRVDPAGEWLYVNETFSRRLSRFPVGPRAELGRKEVVFDFSDGDFPDGLAFDAAGHVWVACIVSNRVLRIDPRTRRAQTVVDAADPEVTAQAERHFRAGALTRADVDLGLRARLGNVSSIAFGGEDLRQVYLGTLGNTALATFRCPVAGAVPPHWHY